ncbi:MAG TPA: maltose alpha-D-glucosyltransferase [Candidatus Binatia bacterium]|nr:maltose alpha-D-glucosyltransferase [Candidatus Binatia bacterium]
MNLSPDAMWYKDAVIYEVHVRAFYDSVTDGIGDFGGLTQKLDHLEDLGVTAVWLLPFCPSPLRDDGYDISDYTDIHPSYGSLKDFQRFLREAHRRGLRVITELVLNHTSDQHVWFQRSRRAPPGSRWRDFYVWSDTPEKYRDARIIFKDFEASNWTWDPVAKAYFWHRFYSHQPDLNWDNPEVRDAMFAAMDFWFDLGVDGLRLDAVPYLFEREGTNCENLPETHTALRELRRHVDEKYRDRMLLAEANQWPEDAAAYFGSGDECHMAFHFPVMPRMFMALRMEDRYPITDILKLTPPIPENCQWAMFLRNHDELTLEMVTDEERDYMYRTYARDREMRINLGIRRRLAPLLENDRPRIELMNTLLFSLPGTPVIYYGDEIGMGDNIFLGDRNGVRTPMQWSSDRNAGFSRANPQRLYLPVNIDPEYHYETINVEAQQNNPHSLLWFTKRLIQQRKQFRSFGRGTLEFVYPGNRKVLAFIRQSGEEKVLVVANLSRFAQCAELELRGHQGLVPVEVFGRARFPAITENPYLLSLGPHASYWFHLQPREVTQEALNVSATPRELPTVEVESAANIFSELMLQRMRHMIPPMLRRIPWFLGKRRYITGLSLHNVLSLPGTSAHILFLNVEYGEGDPEVYLLAVSVATGDRADAVLRDHPDVAGARLSGLAPDDRAVLYAATFDRDFADALLRAIVRRRRIRSASGELIGAHTREFRTAWSAAQSGLEPSPQQSDQCFTTLNYGNVFVLKLYRKLEEGVNPGREVPEFLSEHTRFAAIPRALGSLEFRRYDGEMVHETCLGTLSSFLHNATVGWSWSVDQLGLFFEHALAIPEQDPRVRDLKFPNLWVPDDPVPQIVAELLGNYVDSMRVLARRSAEMHAALSSRPDVPDFAPEPFTTFYRHSVYHGMVGQLNRSFELLRSRTRGLSPEAQESAAEVLGREAEIRSQLLLLRDKRMSGSRIRNHGDYQLSNVVYSGSDWVITNFEGDATRPLSERRIKRSALRDVATMLRSFHYVSHAALFGDVPGIVPRDGHPQLEKWALAWYQWVSVIFLKEYLTASAAAAFLPQQADELKILLAAYMIERALTEIEYELEQRPDWIRIPLHGILEQLKTL